MKKRKSPMRDEVLGILSREKELSIHDVESMTKASRRTIYATAESIGYYLYSDRPKRVVGSLASQIIENVKDGELSANEIAKRFGCSNKYAYKVCEDAGIKLKVVYHRD